MLEDEHRSLSRDARNLSEDEFVGDQVPQHSDGDVGEILNDLPEPLAFFGVLGHENSAGATIFSCAAPSFFDLAQHGIKRVSGIFQLHAYRHNG